MRQITLILAILMLVGCDKQRDLYIMVSPHLYVKGEWQYSLGSSDMTMKATGVAYSEHGEFMKEYFYAPDNVTIPVAAGLNNVMIFNGLMYSPTETHLDEVYFRGTESFSSFEAVAAEGVANRRLTRSEGEYIASNNMEIVTSASSKVDIENEKTFKMKYRDGKNGIIDASDGQGDSLILTPIALSYKAQIVAKLENVSSAFSVSAALYGFVGSVYMAERKPSHFFVTHQFNLNSKKMLDEDADIGTIESSEFVTFGPPIDMPEQKYELFLKITLVNGEEMTTTIDITEQIEEVIELIKANLDPDLPIQHGLEIPINIELTLPKTDPVEGSIGVEDWGDDEIIRIEIKK